MAENILWKLVSTVPLELYVILIVAFIFWILYAKVQKQKTQIEKSDIKMHRVANGPYGDARFATKEEMDKDENLYTLEYNPVSWRKDPKSRPTEPGLLLGDWHETGQKDSPLRKKGIEIANKSNVDFLKKTIKSKEVVPKVKEKGRVKYLDDNNKFKGGIVKTRLCTNDTHALLVASSGAGKTAYFLNPQIEYALATGISFVITDTKGDIDRNYGKIARDKYGYKTVLVDLRNPMRSSKFNILHMVSKYTALYKEEAKINPQSEKALQYLAKRETYAKICSKTIITAGSTGDFGQNAYFYDSAEGLLTACILLVCEYAKPEEQHIISVYKLIQSLSGSTTNGNGNTKSEISKILDMLPPDSKIKMFAGASAEGGESQATVVSTAMSRLISFLDTETEQILCFASDIDAEEFVSKKTVLILTMPEEFNTRYFMVSLIIQELYRELLTIADEYGGRVPATEGFRGQTPRVMFFLDEFGTLPKIDSAEMMFSAARSRNILFVAIIQGTVQLDKNYGKEGGAIIRDNCQLQFATGLSPQTDDAENISKRLGTYTAKGISVSRSKADKQGSKTENVVSVNLMTPDEVRTMPVGDFIVMRTGKLPLRVHYDIFLDWGIPPFKKSTERLQYTNQRVSYATREEIEIAIQKETDERRFKQTQTAKKADFGSAISMMNKNSSKVERTNDWNSLNKQQKEENNKSSSLEESIQKLANKPKEDNPFEMWDELAEYFQYADDNDS